MLMDPDQARLCFGDGWEWRCACWTTAAYHAFVGNARDFAKIVALERYIADSSNLILRNIEEKNAWATLATVLWSFVESRLIQICQTHQTSRKLFSTYPAIQ